VVVVTLISLFLPAAPASAAQAGAQLTVNGGGTVRIDGVPAATGATIFPGSRVSTDAGTTAAVSSGGSRVMINNSTDAIVTYAGNWMRADLICGSASGMPAGGSTVELITHGDTSVFVQSGTLQVQAGGRSVELMANQSETFEGGVHIMSNGAAFDASTLLCSCLCAAPLNLAPIVAASSSLLLLLLLGAAAAAATTVVIATNGGDEGSVVLSPAAP
jgi:hypothetical protein